MSDWLAGGDIDKTLGAGLRLDVTSLNSYNVNCLFLSSVFLSLLSRVTATSMRTIFLTDGCTHTKYQYRTPFFYIILVFIMPMFLPPSWVNMSEASFSLFFWVVNYFTCVDCCYTCKHSQLYKVNVLSQQLSLLTRDKQCEKDWNIWSFLAALSSWCMARTEVNDRISHIIILYFASLSCPSVCACVCVCLWRFWYGWRYCVSSVFTSTTSFSNISINSFRDGRRSSPPLLFRLKYKQLWDGWPWNLVPPFTL